MRRRFRGPLKNPVRNVWITKWGLIAVRYGDSGWRSICGPIRGIPFGGNHRLLVRQCRHRAGSGCAGAMWKKLEEIEGRDLSRRQKSHCFGVRW
jgi:hypothetical protein